MRDTYYVLEDGTAVHPSEVAPNEDGRLAHKSGLVAMRDDGETPRSRGVDVDEAAPPKATVDMRPAAPPAPVSKRPYKTRQAKAR